MNRLRKIMALAISMMMLSSVPVLAQSTLEEDIAQSTGVARLDTQSNMAKEARASYNVYSDAWWLFNSAGVPTGARGWTRLISKTTGDDIYHYSNIWVWYGENHWESGRKWGTGKVYASVYSDRDHAMTTWELFYGTES